MAAERPKVGLVLGAGGLVAQAYHAGVLAALALDLGWDPRTAEVIVGTSAGSITGAALRLGVPARDLAAWAVETPISAEGATIFDAIGTERPDLPPFDGRHLLRPWRLPSRHLLRRLVVRPWRISPLAAALTLAPSGQVDLTRHLVALDQLAAGTWPSGLWICAARRSDSRRVTFGRPGSPTTTLATAVAASCAIPGYFAPVRVDGLAYIDGGVHSPTNADVLLRADVDLVIVVSPMSARRGTRPADAPMRWHARRKLDREVHRLRQSGTPVVRIEPGSTVLEVMGRNPMDEARTVPVVQQAFFDTAAATSDPRATALLRQLAAPSPPTPSSAS
ncbi:MAG TPA: patatin-like phospholipase family protein [Acidimicrobiales bacterium]|nr:patatin-like phospholipase family protein [Acidimicrobiales bacterium]